MDDLKVKLQELYQCFFGTIEKRDPEEGVRRPRHLHDGWREGHSKPFILDDVTYDVIPDKPAATAMQFRSLAADLYKRIVASSDTRKDCCRQEENLGPTIQERPDLSYKVCKVCGCRHFELSVDPGILNVDVKPLVGV